MKIMCKLTSNRFSLLITFNEVHMLFTLCNIHNSKILARPLTFEIVLNNFSSRLVDLINSL